MKKALLANDRIKLDVEALIQYAKNLFMTQHTQKEYGPVWNGRQVRNAFQTAVALAGFRCQPDQEIELTQDQFERVSNASNHFNKYMWSVKRTMTDADMARLGMIRDDSYLLSSPAQQMITPDIHNHQPRSTFGQSIPPSMTPIPMASSFMPNMGMAAQQAQQLYSPNNLKF